MSMAVLFTSLCGCSNETIATSNTSDENVSTLHSDLKQLNADYAQELQQTRGWKWWRWLAVAAADVGGAIYGAFQGKAIENAVSASNLAMMIAKDNTKNGSTVLINPTDTFQLLSSIDFKQGYIDGVQEGSAGYMHNNIITSTYNSTLQDRLAFNQIMDMIFSEIEKQTGEIVTEESNQSIYNNTKTVLDSFDINKSIPEFFECLKASTTDSETKQALDICGTVLEGLQYVDDSDTLYISKATNIVNASKIAPSLKASVLNGISVAYASAKLWATDSLKVWQK